jgi:hypothetical protein
MSRRRKEREAILCLPTRIRNLEIVIRDFCSTSPSRGSFEKSLLDEIRFVDVLIVCASSLMAAAIVEESDRASVEEFDDDFQNTSVSVVEAGMSSPSMSSAMCAMFPSTGSDPLTSATSRTLRGDVTQPRRSWSDPKSDCCVFRYRNSENTRSALNDGGQFLRRIERKLLDNPNRARSGDVRGRAASLRAERESWKREAYRVRQGALSHNDMQRIVSIAG